MAEYTRQPVLEGRNHDIKEVETRRRRDTVHTMADPALIWEVLSKAEAAGVPVTEDSLHQWLYLLQHVQGFSVANDWLVSGWKIFSPMVREGLNFLFFQGVVFDGIATAPGTTGELLTWDTDGLPTTVPVGEDNQPLVSNGPGTTPTFQTPDYFNFFNGCTSGAPDASVTSDGATITLSLEASGGGDLTYWFGGKEYILDCTPAATLALTAGTDTVPVRNFIYVTESGGVLTLEKSTSGFPATSFAAVAEVYCGSASLVQSKGLYDFHQWTDHFFSPTENGAATHYARKLRALPVSWKTGVDAGDLATGTTINTTAGTVYQLHLHTMPAIDLATGDEAYLINDPVTPFLATSDLSTGITVDANGDSLANKRFNIVVWGAVAEDDTHSKLYINLPSGFYNNDTAAIDDTHNTAILSIPPEFTGTGFLIARYSLRLSAGTLTQLAKEDLRGAPPHTTAGGSGGGGLGEAFTTITADSGSDAIADISNDSLAMTGGEGIATVSADDPESVTFNMDLSQLTTQMFATPSVTNDRIPFWDASDTGNEMKWIAIEDMNLPLNAFQSFTVDDGIITATVANDLMTLIGNGDVEVLKTATQEATVSLPDKNKTLCKVIEIRDPADTDEFTLFGTLDALTIRKIYSFAEGGTDQRWNIDIRDITTPETTGTNMFTTPSAYATAVTATGHIDHTSEVDTTVAANKHLKYTGVAGGTGGVTKLIIHIFYTID